MCGNEANVEGGICSECRDKSEGLSESQAEDAMFNRN